MSMSKKTKGIVAGVAGGALLLGAGGTFALWSDSETVHGGTIQAGTLDVSVGESTAWYDASQDRSDAAAIWSDFSWDAVDFGAEDTLASGVSTEFGTLAGPVTGHPIDLSSWRAVPGDFVLGTTPVNVAADGDNLKATLSVDAPGGADGPLAAGLGLRTVVVAEDGSGNFVEVLGTAEPGDPVLLTLPSGTHHLHAYVVANFPSGVTDQNFVGTTATLSDLEISLKQVR
jgi:alternate signal-mediated exported protein